MNIPNRAFLVGQTSNGGRVQCDLEERGREIMADFTIGWKGLSKTGVFASKKDQKPQPDCKTLSDVDY